jgi:general secretion pathway protein A
MSDLLHHWKLATRPFEAPWDTRFFYRSAQHMEALDRMTYLVLEGSMNMGLITGEIGCGKTMVRSVLQHSLAASEFRIVSIENSGFTMDDLLGSILTRLSNPDAVLPESRLARLELLQTLLESQADAGRQVVLLLDEAQEMSSVTLNELRWLTNFNGGGRNVITVILIGQPNLRPLIEALPAINQRISLRHHLRPLATEDIANYLAHRLHVAGHPTGQLFDVSATEVLHRLTRGVPREVNRLAKLTLEYGYGMDANRLSAEHIMTVASDLQRHQSVIA